jgi:hypothetical protein
MAFYWLRFTDLQFISLSESDWTYEAEHSAAPLVLEYISLVEAFFSGERNLDP